MWNHQGSHFEIVRPQCRYKQQAFMSKLSLCPKIAGFDKQLKQLYNFKFKFLVLPKTTFISYESATLEAFSTQLGLVSFNSFKDEKFTTQAIFILSQLLPILELKSFKK